jgi:hypothetical protein
MALSLRCGEVVQLSSVHRLREVWREVVGADTAAVAGAEAPLELLEAHVHKRRPREVVQRRMSVTAGPAAAEDEELDEEDAAAAAEAAEAAATAAEEDAVARAAAAAKAAAAARGACSVSAAIAHARARHETTGARRASMCGPGETPPPVQARLSLTSAISRLVRSLP